jgi:hypothetical protein
MAALLAAALAFAGCQDGYPIPATLCDRACDPRQGSQCEGYSPASCVITCEETLRSSGCHEQFEELLRCMEEHQKNLMCDASGRGLACEVEQGALQACAALRKPHP